MRVASPSTLISHNTSPTITLKEWTYATTDTTNPSGNWIYYNVHKVKHSDLLDENNHAWQCQDTTYDEGVASGVPQPNAGWPTTETTYSTCGDTSTAIKSYTGYDTSGAVTRTFYDSQGRKVETLTPGPGSTQTTVSFTVYNDAAHTVFSSVPFVVASRSTWLDPNGATDSSGTTPGGWSMRSILIVAVVPAPTQEAATSRSRPSRRIRRPLPIMTPIQ